MVDVGHDESQLSQGLVPAVHAVAVGRLFGAGAPVDGEDEGICLIFIEMGREVDMTVQVVSAVCGFEGEVLRLDELQVLEF